MYVGRLRAKELELRRGGLKDELDVGRRPPTLDAGTRDLSATGEQRSEHPGADQKTITMSHVCLS
jgi:hypothetical protein